MKDERGYRKLKVWLASKELVKLVYVKLSCFPPEERYALCDQLRRAVVSIPSNIAEGYGRDTHKDFAHFLGQAKGSLYEVDTQLDIAVDLGYLKRDSELESKIDEISRMLSAFRTRLLTTPTPTPHPARSSAECGVLSAESSSNSARSSAERGVLSPDLTPHPALTTPH